MKKLSLLSFSLFFFSASTLFLGRSLSSLSDSETSHQSFAAASCFGTACDSGDVLSFEAASLDPKVLLYANEEREKIGFVLDNVSEFDRFDYTLKYTHITEFGEIEEMITGQIDNPDSLSSLIEEWILLGTCSSGVCTYHLGITEVSLSVDMVKEDVIIGNLTDLLNF